MKDSILIIILSFVFAKINAQEDYIHRLFYTNPYILNPAAAGLMHDYAIGVGLRIENITTDNNRQTYIFSYDQDIPSIRSGIGIVAYYHNADIYYPQRRFGLSISHCFIWELGNDAEATVGIRLGLVHLRDDLSKFPVPNALPSGQQYPPLRTIPFMKTDIDLGGLYRYGHFVASASVRHINNPKWEYGGGYPIVNIYREVNIGLYYKQSFINEWIWLYPQVLMSSRNRQGIASLGAMIGIKDVLYFGGSYFLFDKTRFANNAYDYSLQTMMQLKKRIVVNFSYDHIRIMSAYNNANAFEVSLIYQLPAGDPYKIVEDE